MDETLEQWFAREILAHERSLMRYLARVWHNRADIADLRQDIYIRIFESAMQALPALPKSFLFATARHLMTDRLRRSRIILIGTRGDLDALNVLVEEISPEQRLSAHQELGRLAQAFDDLPPKCRQVTWLRKVEQLSQKAVAVQLGMTEKAVEKQVARGMRLLARALLEGAEHGGLAVESSESESEHG